ncbi:MAG: hypothetical protein HWN79_14615 [Candidatus Lokiarchaeota archaeon]|nr:hypothetical protein [Candidatus Lokiarchaeota archaeon]
MADKELLTILKSIGEKVKGKELTFKRNSRIFFDILESNNNSFKEFKEKIRIEWEQFKIKNQNRIIKKTYSTFFFKYFHDYFKFYLQNFCGFDTNSLDLTIKEKISDDQLFLEYSYSLSLEEQEYFKEFNEAFSNGTNGVASPIGYLYLVVAILGVNLRRLLKEQFYIVLDGAILKNGENKNTLKFLVVIKNSHDELFDNYYYMYLYYFLKYFKDVPKPYFEKLLEGREKVYKIALDEYSSAKDKLVDLLYYFYKKCNLLQNISPLLDFLNFVCSRVEDSVFPKLDIIKKEFLQNFDYTDEKKNSLLRIFDTIDKKATLYSTFQSNNLPSQKAQFNLFLLYTKYFFGSGSLEALEVGDLLFLPEDFKIALNRTNKKLDNVINANTIKDIQEFFDNFSIISNSENPNLFFQIIFNKDISQINYDFFRAFLNSINTSIKRLIDTENKILEENPINEPLTFKLVVDHICRMLYVLIDKIFIRKLPGQASKNFIDPRSRYVGRNIALRVLELFMFSDFNVSDDVWPDVIISLNKDTLLKDLKNYQIEIPEKHFYQYEDFDRFLITFNFLSSKNLVFEEWLISGIIIPINNFILKIRNLIEESGKKSEAHEVLRQYFINKTKEIEDIQDLEFICRQISVIWEDLS